MAENDLAHSLEPPTCDDRLLWDVWQSKNHFNCLVIADQLKLFSYLEKKLATAQEVAVGLSLSYRPTEAVLAVLTSLGFLAQNHGKFTLNEVSRNFLLPESPYYWGGVFMPQRDACAGWLDILLGDPPEGENIGDEESAYVDQWESGDLIPDYAKYLTDIMHSMSFPTAVGLSRIVDLSKTNRVLDVGGGSGCFCIALAIRNPKTQFTVMDLPPVCDIAKQYIKDYGLLDQIDTCEANMFRDSWPTGYDAVFFSNIFHDWRRDQCVELGERSYDILPQGGRIYINEALLNDTKDGPLTVASFSLLMQLQTKGRQFTENEIFKLLKECGFEDPKVTPGYGYFSLISAMKP
jgi:predicted O-methyltransferase YrrM